MTGADGTVPAPGSDAEDRPLPPRPVLLDLPGGVIELAVLPRVAPLAPLLEELWAHVLLGPASSADAADPEGPESPAAASDSVLPRHRLVCGIDDPPEPRNTSGEPGAPEVPETVVGVLDDADAYAVSGAVTREVIAAHVGERLLLHAGAIAHPSLGTVVLVGESGTGKSTATTLLAREGAYLTDELTILDPRSLAVTAFPKPISRVDPGDGPRRKRDHALAADGLVVADAAPAPERVVLLARRRGDDASAHAGAAGTVRRVPLAEAVPRLVAQSSSVWELPDGLGVIVRLLEGAGGAVEVAYTEAAELPALLADLPPALPEEHESVDGTLVEAAEPGPGEIARAPFASALRLEAAVVVLRSGAVVSVQGIGAVVMSLLLDAGAVTPAVLEEALVAEIGEHPESARILADVLDELVRQELAVRGDGSADAADGIADGAAAEDADRDQASDAAGSSPASAASRT
ncbi:hypothetical protein [Brachybacterium huguangmaarense]